jgi:hypothetical protein
MKAITEQIEALNSQEAFGADYEIAKSVLSESVREDVRWKESDPS